MEDCNNVGEMLNQNRDDSPGYSRKDSNYVIMVSILSSINRRLKFCEFLLSFLVGNVIGTLLLKIFALFF